MQANSRLSLSLLLVITLFTLSRCTNTEAKPDDIDPVASMYSNTQVISNITYRTIDSIKLLLDIYVPCKRLGEPPWNEYSNDRKPTLLYFHGGGWRDGDKISRSLFLMPYVSKGWCVVTANYRHLDQTTLPNIIGDARSAMNWIYDNADKYKFDTSRIVVSGESAGGHLCLATGLITNDSMFHPSVRPAGRVLKAAAIVNWFGVGDLNKAAKTWDSTYYNFVTKGSPQADNILKISSPITYITSSSPPVITIHGDQDKAASYDQAPWLHEKLKEAGVKNLLHTIPGKKHGNFDGKEMSEAYEDIWKFLKESGIQK
jgi:acetyl esterase/lipase